MKRTSKGASIAERVLNAAFLKEVVEPLPPEKAC